MASNKHMSVVFVVAAMMLCLSATTTTSSVEEGDDEGGLVNVIVVNALPRGSGAIKVQCKSSDGEYVGKQRLVGVGAEYRLAYAFGKVYTYVCEARWGSKFGKFTALNPNKPYPEPNVTTLTNVVWGARVDGFYLNSVLDRTKWTKKAVWLIK